MGRTSDADQRLMDATLALIWEESYGSVTIDEICKRADVKKGSFYYFFDSKADLAVAALEKLWSTQLKPNLDAIFSSSVDPLVRLTKYFETIYTFHNDIKLRNGKVLGCPICSVGSEVSTQEVDVCAKIRDIMARKRKYYESAIRDAMAEGVIETSDLAELSLSIFALIEGLISQARIMNDTEILRRLPAMALGILKVKPAGSPVPETAVHA
jgi:TetR/AcrR family transcriptional regulator, transcriptional repressor for nem operon